MNRCPSCDNAGERVDPITLRALLTADGLRRGVPDEPHFCTTETCPVVYFGSADGALLSEADLRVRVHAKHPLDEAVPVCYCFDYTPKQLTEEIALSGTAAAISEDIVHQIQAGRCACEVRNPRGACCLGDVARLEWLLRAELEKERR